MPKKYDAALRDRVICAVDRGQRPLKLDAHADWLAALRASEPELSCQAVVDRLAEEKKARVHETTLWYWLRRNGITHKKRP